MMVYTGANYLVGLLTDETEPSGTVHGSKTITPIGVGAKIGTYEHNYQLEKAFGIGDRVVDEYYSKGFEGSISFDIIYSESLHSVSVWSNSVNFLSNLLSKESVSEIDIYLFEVDGEVLAPSSLPSGQYAWILHGFKPDSVKISARAGEFVGLSIDGKFASSEYVDITTSVSGDYDVTLDISMLTDNPLTFANASISESGHTFLGASGYNYVKEFEIDIKHNLENIFSLNTLTPKEYQEQKYDMDITLNVYMDSNTWSVLTSKLPTTSNFMQAPYTYPDTTLTLTLTGASTHDTIEVDNISLSSYSSSFEDANVVEGSMKLLGRELALTGGLTNSS